MKREDFYNWLASLFSQTQYSARRLLTDKTALHFLIAWSLFEAKLANGNFKVRSLLSVSFYPDLLESELGLLKRAALHLHKRYQCKPTLLSLSPLETRVEPVFERVATCLQSPIDKLSGEEVEFFCLYVASRLRNNIFHGVKGIDEWLSQKSLIEAGTEILMVFVSAAERKSPSLDLDAA